MKICHLGLETEKSEYMYFEILKQRCKSDLGAKKFNFIRKKMGATTPPPYTGTRAVPESAIKDLQCTPKTVEMLSFSG